METRLLARADVGEQPVEGPAVIESYDCTIVVPPSCSAQADASGTIDISLDGKKGRIMNSNLDPIPFADVKRALVALIDCVAYNAMRTARTDIRKRGGED